MRFGTLPLAEAEGAILAHSLTLPDGKLKKGSILRAAEIARLSDAGHRDVVAAKLSAEDLGEDAAAARLAAALTPDPMALGLDVSAPFTGRVNLYARADGVLGVDADLIHAINRLDEAITVACLPPHERVTARQMVATVKIIPYAVPERAVAQAEALAAGGSAFRLHPLAIHTSSLVLTRTPGMADKLLEKGARAIRQRLDALGVALFDEQVVAHEADAVGRAVREAGGGMVLILTASATSDRADVGPAGVVAAGGEVSRVGMPVDPGNLLFLGAHRARPVIGLPGCARSPKLNGADWVLERIACGIPTGPDEIAAMGVGGLLKEIPSRPSPRDRPDAAPRRPMVAGVILAAGSSTRMRGADKLLEEIGDTPLIVAQARRAAQSALEEAVVVLDDPSGPRAAALARAHAPVRHVVNRRASEGMGTSIAAGVAALGPEVDAAMILLADMPEIGPAEIARLIAAFDPEEGREIVRAVGQSGQPGHPVLFGRRFFEPLAALGEDRGARDIIAEHGEFVVDVPLAGDAALTDLDTPEDWAAWRERAAPVNAQD